MLAECSPLGTVVFLSPYVTTGSDILKTAGSPCRPVLKTYAEISLISKFIIEVLPLPNLESTIVIQAKNICTNCVLVEPHNSPFSYIVKVPNNYEHH